MHISSTSNPLIKEIQQIREKARARAESKSFLVEGDAEIQAALRAGFKLRSMFCLENRKADFSALHADIITVSTKVLERLSLREDCGAIAWFNDDRLDIRVGKTALTHLRLSNVPLLAILEGIEKPGNLGAIFRSAAAAGVDAVLICAERCDLFHPHTIRNSIGAVFSTQVAVAPASEIMAFCRAQKITMHAAHLDGDHSLYELDLKKPSAIVLGSEAQGLSTIWTKKSSPYFKIPMHSLVDSLNVSVATAICLYEAKRQRL